MTVDIRNDVLFYEINQKKVSYDRKSLANFFEILSIPVDLIVDIGILQKHYFELQMLVHPDRYTNKSNEEKQLLLEFSSVVNKAYKCLENKTERLIHLLQLNGIKEDAIPDSEFMMESMDWHERIMEGDNTIKQQLQVQRG